MPHIHLETTADLPENGNVPDILEGLVATLASVETVASNTLKAYHTLRSNWAVGEGHPAGFAHITIRVLSGRSEELRATMTRAVADSARGLFAESLGNSEVRLSVELVEMDAATYISVAS